MNCPFYHSKRLILAQHVIPIITAKNLAFLQNDVNLYLYGHKKLTYDDNTNIIQQTINFIKTSHRFDTSE